ncbi:uncharacterized protein [Diadema antillarum]|uniref:uncharacterized protein n=1 Tax=Diadema antillarum TaxID=105358 RepID=UPI003A86EA23
MAEVEEYSRYSDAIKDVMVTEGVFPDEIPERTARQGVRGFAVGRCGGCARTWSSHRAHVVIDLKRQTVHKIWKQKCKKCDTPIIMSFNGMEFQSLVEKAIEQEKKYRNPMLRHDDDVVDDDGGRRAGPPHESSLCEKCEYGKTQCWKKRSSTTN